MTVYVVTSLAQEKDKYGVIQRVDVRCHGVFTGSDRADQIATKVNGSVTTITVDEEWPTGLQHWLNPGYAS